MFRRRRDRYRIRGSDADADPDQGPVGKAHSVADSHPFAIEATPSAIAKKGGAVWEGTIKSDTSRQYLGNGSLVNTCKTSWKTVLRFVVNSGGGVAGSGESKLDGSVSCSPHPVSGNTESMPLQVQGQKDSNILTLVLLAVGYAPAGSGEFGGFQLLFNSGTCPATQRTLEVPVTDAKTASATLDLSATMTGCAGSADDIVTSANAITLKYLYDCDNRPLDQNDSTIDKLCQ